LSTSAENLVNRARQNGEKGRLLRSRIRHTLDLESNNASGLRFAAAAEEFVLTILPGIQAQ
jgi:hypothetical protein